MRIARKLMLLALMVMTVMALSTPTASAVGVELTDEETGIHCGIISSSCLVEAHSESSGWTITAHLLNGVEVVALTCQDEFIASVGEDGEGALINQVLSGATCPNKPCEATSQSSGDGDPWPVHFNEVDVGVFQMHMVFCLEPAAGGGSGRNCEITVDINDNGSHHYEFLAVDAVCGGTPPPAGVRAVEVDGHWLTEEHTTSAHTNVEISHG
jgi:hypothetical protein